MVVVVVVVAAAAAFLLLLLPPPLLLLLSECAPGGSNCSIRVRTAILGVPRGEGGVRVRVRGFELTRGGFELFDTSLNWLRTSASEGMGGEVRVRVRGREFFFWAGGGVRVRVRGFELSSFEGGGGRSSSSSSRSGDLLFVERWGGELEFEFEGSKCY